MSVILRWFLKFLLKLKIFDCIYPIVYSGKGVSLNQYYSGGHWSYRSKLKNKYKEIFEELLSSYDIKPMEQFSLVVFFNSRHDTDNVTGLTKLFIDTLKGVYIEDDNKKYFRFYGVVPDEKLPTNTFEFYLISHGDIDNNVDRRLTAKFDSGKTIPGF